MSIQKQQALPRTSRSAEERYLSETLEVIQSNIASYGQDVDRMRTEIDYILEHFHDDNPELINNLENTITMHDHLKRALERNEKAQNKPYFGRIIFHDNTLHKLESLYIGKGGISRDATHWMVIDWRAPVANTYYENGLGKCTYPSPSGEQLPIELLLKRTYEIENGRLQNYYESEMIANDDLLTKYLSKNKQAVLGEIVATIQKEQNEIIRKSPYHNCLVQGVAGSGKTTVAMHRISYILYNYAERFKPDDFYIVGSNRILLNYITGVLPDLDVYGIRQMTMEQLFVRLLYEDWDEKKYQIRSTVSTDSRNIVKGTLSWFRDLEAFCNTLEWQTLPRESVYLNPKQFVEGIRNGVVGVFDESNGEPADPSRLVLLTDRAAIERYILQNPKVSLQSKINMLNERLDNKIKEEFLGKGVTYTEYEKKAIQKAFRGHFGARTWKKSIYTLYQDFLKQQAARGQSVDIPDNKFDVYDLAALAYLYKRLKETEVISEAHHIVIDEAQDFGMMAYSVLHFCIKDCTYTIMGDVSQNIHFGYGLSDWEELRALYLTDEADSFGILKKSYRNTVEISQFATNILQHGQFFTYPVEPIIRHGEPVTIREVSATGGLFAEVAEICKKWQEKGLETIAVICRDTESAAKTAAGLSSYLPIPEYDLEKASFENGIMVLPVSYTKGLEFDAVLILNPTRTDYPVDDGHAKLLYVAATRALHELCVLHSDNTHGNGLTGLIADPVPAKKSDNHSLDSDSQISASKRQTVHHILTPTVAQPTVSNEVSRKRPAAVLPKTRPGISIAISAPAGIPPAKIPPANVPLKNMVPTELHKPMGHARIDLSVRWVNKQADGLYLQSRYGILRLSPVSSNIIRVTFSRSGIIASGSHPQIVSQKSYRSWMYKDAAKQISLMTDTLSVLIDKSTGAILFQTIDKQILLAERAKECRQLETLPDGSHKNWLYLELQKNEHLYPLTPENHLGEPLRGTASCIHHPSQDTGLPLLLSDRGYALLPATVGCTIFGDTTAYGTYLYTEGSEQMDYYFIAGNKPEALVNAYRLLCRPSG